MAGSTGSTTANFDGDCGECTKGYYTAHSVAGMQPGQDATVNNAPTQNCVIANDGGTVYGISVISNAGFYSWQIRIDAKGPSGIGSGSMYLAFKDQTGDVYYIYIYSSRREWHTLSYNSAKPAITDIYWSNYSFSVKDVDASRPKPEYKVESHVEPAG